MSLVFGSMIWMKGAYISYFEEIKKGGEGGRGGRGESVGNFLFYFILKESCKGKFLLLLL